MKWENGKTRQCEICNNEPAVCVACSSVGAFSFAYGERCAAFGLEPIGMIQRTVDDCGGWGNVANWIQRYPAAALHAGLAHISN